MSSDDIISLLQSIGRCLVMVDQMGGLHIQNQSALSTPEEAVQWYRQYRQNENRQMREAGIDPYPIKD